MSIDCESKCHLQMFIKYGVAASMQLIWDMKRRCVCVCMCGCMCGCDETDHLCTIGNTILIIECLLEGLLGRFNSDS